MEFSSEGIFGFSSEEDLENYQNEDFDFNIFEKGQILRPFSGLAPSKLK